MKMVCKFQYLQYKKVKKINNQYIVSISIIYHAISEIDSIIVKSYIVYNIRFYKCNECNKKKKI